MKAAVYSKAEAGKVLEIRDLDQPLPKDDEALLRVRAASVNPLDWRMKTERPGVDVAGEIIAVGKHVRQFKPGDAVFGGGKGSFAEYVCARESKLASKPESVSFEQAAAVPIAGITALQALRDAAHLQAGQKVLINGAAGGLGTFAVQIAKSFGAHVTGVCSTKNVELVRSLGADRVIDYTCEDFTKNGERYDLLLDNVGNRRLSAMKSVLRPNGRCVIAGAPKKMSAVFTWLLKIFTRSLLLRQNFKFLIANINRDDLTTVGELITAGKVTPMIDRRYPLSGTADAMAYAEEGHSRAKVVITFECGSAAL
ncbi:MAG TPA: NAD(P)-dependent alcohol dehydrogenase [Terriglobales bacterium]